MRRANVISAGEQPQTPDGGAALTHLDLFPLQERHLGQDLVLALEPLVGLLQLRAAVDQAFQATADRAEQVEFALALQKACAVSARAPGADRARVGNLLAALLQQAYDLDILEEEGILAWWADPRGNGGSSGGDEMAAVRQKCQPLVEWLQEDDDDEESDSEDDEDEEVV